MSLSLPGTLVSVPPHSRYIEFVLAPSPDPLAILRDPASRPFDADAMVGFGSGLLSRLASPIERLPRFPHYTARPATYPRRKPISGCSSAPMTAGALSIWRAHSRSTRRRRFAAIVWPTVSYITGVAA